MTDIKISVIVIHRIIILNINNVFKTKLKSIMINLCFVLFLVCLYVCICECLPHNNMRMYTSNQYPYVRGPLRECRSIRSGASGLPYYCVPLRLVFISVVMELLSVSRWQHNEPKTKKDRVLCGITNRVQTKNQKPSANRFVPGAAVSRLP